MSEKMGNISREENPKKKKNQMEIMKLKIYDSMKFTG